MENAKLVHLGEREIRGQGAIHGCCPCSMRRRSISTALCGVVNTGRPQAVFTASRARANENWPRMTTSTGPSRAAVAAAIRSCPARRPA